MTPEHPQPLVEDCLDLQASPICRSSPRLVCYRFTIPKPPPRTIISKKTNEPSTTAEIVLTPNLKKLKPKREGTAHASLKNQNSSDLKYLRIIF